MFQGQRPAVGLRQGCRHEQVRERNDCLELDSWLDRFGADHFVGGHIEIWDLDYGFVVVGVPGGCVVGGQRLKKEAAPQHLALSC